MPAPLILHKGEKVALNCHKTDHKGKVLLATSCPYMRPPQGSLLDAGQDGLGMVTLDSYDPPDPPGKHMGVTYYEEGTAYMFSCMLYQDWHLSMVCNWSTESDGLTVYAIDRDGSETAVYTTDGRPNTAEYANKDENFPKTDQPPIVIPKCSTGIRLLGIHNWTTGNVPGSTVENTNIDKVNLTFTPAP